MTYTLSDPTAEAEVFVFPASFAQQRLWFLQQLMPENPAYNVPLAVRLTGQLDRPALEQAFNEIVRRHEALRTHFWMVDGQPVQAIVSQLTVPLQFINLQTIPSTEQSAAIEQIACDLFQRPFNLAKDALLRVHLLQLQETEHVLLLTLHHIVADGWSIAILVRELGTLYTAFAAGQPSPLPELPIQYADFAHWQRQWLQAEVLTDQLTYWRQQLNGAPAVLDLPIARPLDCSSSTSSFHGAREALLLPPDLRQAIVQLSDRTGTTLFMTLLAAFQTLLYRYSGQTDISVGSPIANRNRSEIEGLIGFFVNSLVLRTDLSGNPTFRQLLDRVREVALGAYAHQDLPFEKLVEAVQPERDLNRNPLFQVVFALQNAPIETLKLAGLTLSPLPLDPGTARLDLEFQLVECLDGLGIVAVYRTDRFDQPTIARMLGHFQVLLEGIVANPDRRLSDFPLLTAREQHQLLIEWNQTQTDYPKNWCIHHWFEAQVQRTPDAVAVVFVNQQLTYRQLNDRSNQLAQYLQRLGAAPEMLIGICLERSIEMLIAVLGVLKAGAAYVPLDPLYPTERLQWMLNDAQVPILLTQRHLIDKLLNFKQGDRPTVVCLDQEWRTIGQHACQNPTSSVTVDHLAYVIYTSGSTGTPKGVQVPHRGLSNLAQAQREIFNMQPSDRILQFASLSFDASIFEIIMALSAGASLHLAKPSSLLGTDLIHLLQAHNITQVTLPPTLLKQLPPAKLPHLKTVIAAGEACSADLVDRWATHCRFFNAYGLTETSVWATVAQLKADEPVSIGRAIANTQLYVLDSQLQPVPIGIPGELYIGGSGVARGYLNRLDITAERFIPNLFSADSRVRLYKTGDRVRYCSDGKLKLISRIDQQVKLRGYRIELGEIEAVLSQHPAVQMAIAFVHETASSEKQLVASITLQAQHTVTASELKNFLRQTLPEYLIPAAFSVQPTLPRLPNGKIDRLTTAEQFCRNASESLKLQATESHVIPRTSIEADLAALWAKQLDLKTVSITQNFFDSGGDSLTAMRLMEQIEQQFGRSLPLSSIFLAPTVEQLAKLLEPNQSPNSSVLPACLVPLQPKGTNPPFFCVHPIFGTVFPYYHLARQLGHQPFYGLQPLGLDGKPLLHLSIEDMAAHYIQALRQIQPQSPYFIGGWSFGGVVAFEMAQQLHQAGHQVALLAILDTPAPIAPSRPAWREGFSLLTTVARSILPFAGDYGSLIAASIKTALFQQKQQFSPEARSQLLHEIAPLPMMQIYRANMQAFLNYAPQVYPGEITLFKATESSAQAAQNPTLNWHQLTSATVKVHSIPGNHLTLLRQPHVQTLSKQLRQHL